MKKFYQIMKNKDTNELYIYGEITSIKWYEDDVCAFDLAKELNELEGDIIVRINSYGGEVQQGLAIYNLLKDYKGKVTTINDGFACSIASVIFMAGDVRIMKQSSLLMIHNAWTYAVGDSNELRKQADDLEKITKPSLNVYKENSNLSEEEIKKMLDEETWLEAEEALEYGFATSITEEKAKQSLENHYLAKMILENKRLKKQREKKADAWSSFFNGGK